MFKANIFGTNATAGDAITNDQTDANNLYADVKGHVSSLVIECCWC